MKQREGRIVPSVLTDDPEVFRDRIRQLEPMAPVIQVDIMDGMFVPAQSIGAGDVEQVSMRSEMEVHLMVMEPRGYIEDFARCGARSVVFHIEPVADPERDIGEIRRLGMVPGLALNPDTPVGAVKQLLARVELVIVMGVHPGRQGQEFIPEVLEKVRVLKGLSPDILVEVDGGMNPETGRVARLAGTDILNVGSYLFSAGTLQENWERMQEIARTVIPE